MYVFTNAVGGGGWNTSGNWSIDGVGPVLTLPGPTDDALIPAGANVVLSGDSATVNSVGLSSGSSLTINSVLETNGMVSYAASLLTVNAGSPKPGELKIDQSATFGGQVIDTGLINANTTNPFTGTSITFTGGALIGPGDLNGNLVAGPNSSITFAPGSSGEFLAGATLGPSSGA